MTANAQTQWILTEYESATTLETWRINLMSILSLEVAFEPFLRRDVIWGRKTKTNPFRGFSCADAEQVSALETMLGLIANYAPIVSPGHDREKLYILECYMEGSPSILWDTVQ